MKKGKSASSILLAAYVCLLAAAGSAVVSINGCSKTEECTVPCLFGTCTGNECNCSSGYEGDSCSVLTTNKFIGDWEAVDTCETNTYVYTATVAASASVINRVVITNFGRFGSEFTITADVSGTTLTIPDQDEQGISLSGSGSIDVVDSNLSILTITYFAEDEFHNTDQCTGVWKKTE
jgi:hypothetical protein